MTIAGRAYVATVIVCGIGVISASLYHVYDHPLPDQWYWLAALTLISGSATVNLPTVAASISISEVFVIASVLLFGQAAGTITVALDGLVISFWMAKRRPEWYRAPFNMAAPAISIWIASQFFALAGIGPLFRQKLPIEKLYGPLLVCTILYFVLNSWLITLAVSFEKRLSDAYRIWRKNLLWLSLNYFSGASVALLLVAYSREVDLKFIGVIIPLLLVLYLTFKTAMARVEDADRHVSQLNRLYLSTIETLAMAIDAKDQVTHGHIRRVQIYATNLAREVGVREPTLIKAIEAAALLHDMGKLAVPEYILNKPGKLTDAEFEKMKLHASVGADILSAVDFPYPVVPIVRHHHENWDGTGYPAKIRGTDIPIGARILSVVDCFDALTSDRPYRPRLSDDDALRILKERRGSMYDPLIVDTFVRVHSQIAPEPVEQGPPSSALNEIASARKAMAAAVTSPFLDEIAAGADEMLTLYELSRSLAGHVSLGDAADIIAKHLRRLIPSSLCVCYVLHAGTNELEAEHSIGDGASLVRGTRIPLGQRLTGWVGANRQTICNSDPTLDFGEVARSRGLRLRSCLSTPLLLDDTLVGVLSLYSGDVNAFTDDHRRIIEMVAGQIAHTFKTAIEFERSAKRDPLTGLPHVSQLEQLIKPTGNDSPRSRYALLLIDIASLKQINVQHGRDAGDEAVRHVVQAARKSLRVADILFRYRSDEFVAFLNATDHETATTVARRIEHTIRQEPVRISEGNTISIDATVTVVTGPQPNGSLADLLDDARVQIRPDDRLGPHIH